MLLHIFYVQGPVRFTSLYPPFSLCPVSVGSGVFVCYLLAVLTAVRVDPTGPGLGDDGTIRIDRVSFRFVWKRMLCV